MPARPPALPAAQLSRQAYEALRAAILKGELPFGAEISRRRLAAHLGMSMIPVGEALQRLEADGLVESRPRSGTRVRRPTAEDIRGHYVVREALESQAARLFAAQATAAQRKELGQLAVELDRLCGGAQGGSYETFQLHARLHARIAQCAGCPALERALEKSHVLVLNWLYNSAAHVRQWPKHWHRDLVRALGQGDPDAADAAMRRHVRFALDDVLRRLAENGLLAEGPAGP